MKKLFLTAALTGASLAVFGQGTVDLANIVKGSGFVAPIFQPNPANSAFEQTGAPSPAIYVAAIPSGTTVYGGLPVTTAYDMVLLYSLNNSITSPYQMSVATIVPFRTAATATAPPAGGIVTISHVPLPGTTGGTPFAFEIGAFYIDPVIAAWQAANPGYTPSQLWNEAIADNKGSLGGFEGEIGVGAIVSDVLAGGFDTTGVSHAEPSTAEAWTSFSLIQRDDGVLPPAPTPEPSTLLLASLGAATLRLLRRRK